MTTPIHVLCSNITEIVRREVVETKRCFGDKKVRKMRFFRCHFAPCGGGRQKSAEERGTWPRTSPCKMSFPSVPICRSYSRKKWFRTNTVFGIQQNSVYKTNGVLFDVGEVGEVIGRPLLYSCRRSLIGYHCRCCYHCVRQSHQSHRYMTPVLKQPLDRLLLQLINNLQQLL